MKRQKGMLSRGLCMLLAGVVLFGPLNGVTAYAAVMGELLQSKALNISEESILANGVHWNSNLNDLMTENYILYEPGETVRPIIAYGRDIYGAASFAAASQVAVSEYGGGTVLAGINGDYFTVANGVVQGIGIKAGKLYTSETASYPSLGFYKDGSAIIGRLNLGIKLSSPSMSAGITSMHLNKAMTPACGVVLYTRAFADDDTNKASIATYNVLVQVSDDEPAVNSTMTGTVYSGAAANGATAIPEGMVLLSMAAGTTYTYTLNQLKALKAGDQVTIEFTADPLWNDVDYGIGAGEKIVTARANVAPMKMSIQTALNPRTAVGIKSDGSLIFYTVDGRKNGHSRGLTLSELANRMIELGAVEAVNLDGGGSTAVHSIYPGNSTLSTINTPSEGSLRNCGNYIMLLNTGSADGQTRHLHPYPYAVQMLAGSRQFFALKATDENYYPSSAPEKSQVEYQADSSLGAFDSEGIFTAGTAAGSGTVSFRSGSAEGTATVNVVTRPDSISILNQANQTAATAVSVSGGNNIDLSISGIYKKMPLTVSDHCFTWTVSGDVGTIDKNGLFTAAKITSGTGTITASLNGVSASVPVTITSSGQQVESFEGTSSLIPAVDAEGLTVKSNGDLTKVRYGRKSLGVTYDFEKASQETLSIPSSISFSTAPDTMNFWVYGDGSGNTLALSLSTPSGNQEVTADVFSFMGWKFVSVEMPAGTAGVQAFLLKNTGAPAGSFYLDQIMRAVGYYSDNLPPAIQLALSGQSLSGVVTDTMDLALSGGNMKLTYDGDPLVFTYDGSTKKLAATLPAPDGNGHKVTLTAADKSGNVQRGTLVVKGGEGAVQPFADMASHWAKESTAYLYNQGIVKGVSAAQGICYKPDTSITRSEFTVMMSRFLGVDESKYTDVKLPFADAATIPSWALNATKAMYSMGIVQGSGSGGKVLFKPQSTISREEVMTIIGRTQERGYAEADLSGFSDSGTVSSWSAPYVKTLVKQEIVTGFDGGLWPQKAVTRAQIATILFKLN